MPDNDDVQTLLAYAFSEPAPARIDAGRARVEAWYDRLWGGEPVLRSTGEGRLGLSLWDRADEECRWPAWSIDGDRCVVTTHVPLGYARLVGSAPAEHAPLALARRLQARPDDVMALTGPFVLADLERTASTLTLYTDGLGLGRLFEVRTSDGRFWSNRPLAALLFAGVRAEADPLAWRRMAACDWAMGDATPYLGVRAIAQGTRIRVGPTGCEERALDVVPFLAGPDRGPLTSALVDAAADGLVATARSMHVLWPRRPVLSISGGRDSRLVAAAFLAAGVDVRLRTYGGAAGEADTARHLVSLLPAPVRHDVTTPVAQRPGARRPGALQRARQWHDVTEGLRPAVYLRDNAPSSLPRHRRLLVSGVGGEFAHAPGYPGDVERLERLPPDRRFDAFARSLGAKVVLPRGLSPRSVAEVDAQVRGVLDHARTRGLADAKALDWFYADEKLRRWGMAGEAHGKVMPLLTPEFVTASFALSTAQSRASALHDALIDRLVPAWSGVPYYGARLAQRHAVRQQRLWEESDVDLVAAVVADPARWEDAFDVDQVQAVWAGARAGRAAGRDELLLQRVLWRAAFDDHLAAVDGGAGATPAAVTARRAPRAPDLTRVVRTAALHANDVTLGRRVARTRFGRLLRRQLGV